MIAFVHLWRSHYLDAGAVQSLQGLPDVWEGRGLEKCAKDVLSLLSGFVTVHALRSQHLLQVERPNLH